MSQIPKTNRLLLLANAAIKLMVGFSIMALLLFLPAGTWHYPHAWFFLLLLLVPMTGLGVYLLLRQPQLLAKRLNNREQQPEQKQVVALSALMFISGFVVCGLDYRFGWSNLPLWMLILAAILFLIAYGLYAEVMRENAYLSRTIEIQEGQQLIDTRLYGLVRHPMYTATILLFLTIPLVLGSAWALLIFICYLIIIVRRIAGEEQVLASSLPGYSDYQRRVPYRLLPGIW
ncbi:MAG: isoprenylcysteine carboxylmethyltransferase family protein [Paludibacteraceae bacterium]|nr:isoprenylcysteine carboxylmethyltransferase family protein [Paludibacteraceae bacterium]